MKESNFEEKKRQKKTVFFTQLILHSFDTISCLQCDIMCENNALWDAV